MTVNGTVYADFYEVIYNYNGYFFSSAFVGPNLIRDPNTGAISGTVTGYLESYLEREHLATVVGRGERQYFRCCAMERIANSKQH